MKRQIAFLLATVLALAVAGPAARAQDIEKEAQKPGREVKAVKKADETAAESEKTLAEGADVTYEQVLADPDNVELNYRFARTQVRQGDLKGASATLERILLVNPNLVKVRFFHAVVLFRLNDLVGAERQFETLSKASLPPEVAEEVASYLKAVRRRQKKTQLSGRLALGFEYDSNRNAAPSSNQRLFLGIPLTLSGSSNRRDDTAVLFMAGVAARRKVGSSAKSDVFATADLYRSEQTLVDTLNLQAISLSAGGTWRPRRWEVTPSALFDHVTLAHQTFLRDTGASVKVLNHVSRSASLYGEVRGVYQDFARTQEVPIAPERSGAQYDLTLGGDRVLSPRMKVGLAGGYTIKDADKAFDAFRRYSLDLNHSWLLGKGTFLYSAVTYNHDVYDEPDRFVSNEDRRDDSIRASATLGAPLSVFHAKLSDFVWTLTYEYYHAFSTIENYAYTNNRLATLLTYRWALGL